MTQNKKKLLSNTQHFYQPYVVRTLRHWKYVHASQTFIYHAFFLYTFLNHRISPRSTSATLQLYVCVCLLTLIFHTYLAGTMSVLLSGAVLPGHAADSFGGHEEVWPGAGVPLLVQPVAGHGGKTAGGNPGV